MKITLYDYLMWIAKDENEITSAFLADQLQMNLSEEELMDYFALGQCTPGVIAVNTAKAETAAELSGIPGKELTDAQMQDLRKAAGEMSAKMRAVRIVSASSVSKPISPRPSSSRARRSAPGRNPFAAPAGRSDRGLDVGRNRTIRRLSCDRAIPSPPRNPQALL